MHVGMHAWIAGDDADAEGGAGCETGAAMGRAKGYGYVLLNAG